MQQEETVLPVNNKPFVGDYSLEVEQIRRMPREGKEDRVMVKRKIGELRGAIYRERTELVQARRVAEEAIMARPDITPEELLREIGVDRFPPWLQGAIEGSVSEHHARAKRAAEVYGRILNATGGSGGEVGKEAQLRAGERLFELKTWRKPEGHCRLRLSPFAVWLAVESEQDYRYLESRKSEGFYEGQAKILHLRGVEGEFPLIVTKGLVFSLDDPRGVLPHEEAHGQNAAIRRGMGWLGLAFRERFWGHHAYPDYAFGGLRFQAYLLEQVGRVPWFAGIRERMRVSLERDFNRQTRDLVRQCLGRAKDELLAEWKNPWGNLDNMLYHLKRVQGEAGRGEKQAGEGEEGSDVLYDYLTEAGVGKMQGPVLEPLVDRLRGKYKRALDASAQPLIALGRAWGSIGLDPENNRRQLVYGMLIPEPLERWPIYIRNTFGEEMAVVREVQTALDRIGRERCELRECAEGYRRVGEEGAIAPVESLEVRMDQESEAVLAGLREIVRQRRGEIKLASFRRAEGELERLHESYGNQLEVLRGEREKIARDLESKLPQTPLYQLLAQIEAEEAGLMALTKEAERQWREYLSIQERKKLELGVDVFEGVWQMEESGELPQTVTITRRNDFSRQAETITLDFSRPEVRKVVEDLFAIRSALNGALRMTTVSSDGPSAKNDLDMGEVSLRAHSNRLAGASVFDRYEWATASFDGSQWEETMARARVAAAEAKAMIEKAEGLISKYQVEKGAV